MYAFEPVSKKEATAKRFKTSNIDFLEEFINSDHEAIKITKFTQQNAIVCCASLRKTIKLQKYNLYVACRDGVVYVIKK
jgi:hypothetical protein